MSLRKLLAAVMVVSMVFGLVGTTVFAQAEAAAVEAATGRLQGFGIVTGDPDGGLRLADSITRAELMAVLVRANGLEDISQLLQGTSAFSDVAADAWYAGYVAIAKSKGWTTGYPDGTFKPGNPVTNAEVLAFLARVAGLAPAAAAWPENYIKAAIDAGLVPADLDLAALASQPAVRGVVFTLADAFFMKVRDANGKNLYQRYHKTTAPVVNLDPLTPQTTSASVKASGKVDGAEAAFVNGNPLVLAADGSFAADVELAVGANDIVITAVDVVGNEGSAKATVERINTEAAHIAAEASLSVAAGASSALATIVHDTNGAEIAGAVVTSAVEPAELGTYDAATGTFTAGTKAGTGTLTLTSGEATATVAVTVTPAAMAKIEVTPGNVAVSKGDIQQFTATGYDAFGNAITGLTPTWVVTNADGSATSKAFISSTGAFIGSGTGTYKVTATVDAFTADATAGIYGTAAAIKVSGPATLVANDASKATFTATLVDANGNVAGGVTTDADILVTAVGLTVNGEDETAFVDIENGVGTFTVTGDTTVAGLVVEIEVTDEGDLGLDEDNNAVALESASAEIELLDQVATGIKVDSNSKYLTANISGQTAYADFVVVDQDGEPMLDGLNYTMEFAVSGPAELDDTDAAYEEDYAGDSVSVNPARAVVLSDQAVTGTVTVTASAEGLGSAAATIMSALAEKPRLIKVSTAATSIVADETAIDTGDPDGDTVAVFKIEFTDAKGVPTPVNGQVDVTVSLADDGDFQVEWEGGGVPGTGAATDDDSATFTFEVDGSSATLYLNATRAGSAKVTVAQGDNTITDNLSGETATLSSGSASVQVVAADPADADFDTDAPVVTLTGNPTLVVPASAPKTSVKVAVVDTFGNTAAVAGVKITLGESLGVVSMNGKQGEVTVKTGADGTATVDLASPPYGGETYSIVMTAATLDGDALVDFAAGSTVDFKIANTVAASVTVKVLYDGQTAVSVPADREVEVRVYVKDSYGTSLVNPEENDFVALEVADGVFALADPSSAADVEDGADLNPQGAWLDGVDDDGVPYFYTNLWTVKAGRHTLTATDSAAQTAVTGSRSFSVKANAESGITAYMSEATLGDHDDDPVSPDEYFVELTTGKATPVTVYLSDMFANKLSLFEAQTILLTPDPEVSIRSSADGAEIADVDTKSSAKIYLVASDAGTYSIDLQVDGEVDIVTVYLVVSDPE